MLGGAEKFVSKMLAKLRSLASLAGFLKMSQKVCKWYLQGNKIIYSRLYATMNLTCLESYICYCITAIATGFEGGCKS